MTDLVTWLRAALDEDDRVARAAERSPFMGAIQTGRRYGKSSAYEHIARHDPARVLAEVAAKRAIIELHSAEPGQHPDFCGHDLRELPCPTLRLLALPYADKDGWQEEWRR